MTKIIGLTGGIGSGKTTLAKQIQSLGIPVYIADEEAKKLIDTPEIIKKIQNEFGELVFENNHLNKEKLAEIVFKSPEKLSLLNQIIHPAVQSDFANWLLLHQKYSIVFKEAAILFESGSYKDCDQIITVVAPLESRIERVMKRDGISHDKVLDRISNQWTDEMKIQKSNFVIDNSTQENALSQLHVILQKLLIQ